VGVCSASGVAAGKSLSFVICRKRDAHERTDTNLESQPVSSFKKAA